MPLNMFETIIGNSNILPKQPTGEDFNINPLIKKTIFYPAGAMVSNVAHTIVDGWAVIPCTAGADRSGYVSGVWPKDMTSSQIQLKVYFIWGTGTGDIVWLILQRAADMGQAYLTNTKNNSLVVGAGTNDTLDVTDLTPYLFTPQQFHPGGAFSFIIRRWGTTISDDYAGTINIIGLELIYS